MPELPEVETTLRGVQPFIEGQQITMVVIRHYRLRWPIPANLAKKLKGLSINTVVRRAKYLLLQTQKGTAILHLGMSGRLRILTDFMPPTKHDHVDIHMQNGCILRFTDPRRFGALLWTEEAIENHALLKNLGIEPLEQSFNGKYLWTRAQNRSIAIKNFIMDNKIVVGVGNIYAAESLFQANIHPTTPANKIALDDYQRLATAIKKILKLAIKKGGTTLKDFLNSEGKPGYFTFSLKVYGRAGLLCFRCADVLRSQRIGQRSTVYCATCQH